jgi:hypothetical protein
MGTWREERGLGSDEGGDPACWLHLFEDELLGDRGDGDDRDEVADGADVADVPGRERAQEGRER